MTAQVKKWAIVATVVMAVCIAPSARAETAMLLMVDGIPGNSTILPAGIDVQAFSWGMSNSTTNAAGGGAGTGKVTFKDITISKMVDKSSPLLYLACATGKHIANATFYVRNTGAGPDEYTIYKFDGILITSCDSDSKSDSLGQEKITISPTKVTMTVLKENDSSTFGWNLTTNTGM